VRESVVGPKLDWTFPELRAQILGGVDAGAIEAELERLGTVRCFFFEVSVGALFGIELGDGMLMALKLHQEHVGKAELSAVQSVQAHLAAHGFPCPQPLLAPTPFLSRLATGEEWCDDGEYMLPDEGRRRAFAALLARQIELCSELSAADALTWIPSHQPLWPRPHNALFDFEATSAGAEWIDEIARTARAGDRAGPMVLAHQDWTFRHVRWRDGKPTVIYDWDAVSCDNESISLGAAAAMHTYPPGEVRGWKPSVADALSFLDAYEDVRPLDAPTRRAAEAHTVYSVAYSSRCEHAVSFEPATNSRSVLRDFAERFL
jgi:Ser/Thr protein kinase RdoA (MazF antagonist)